MKGVSCLWADDDPRGGALAPVDQEGAVPPLDMLCVGLLERGGTEYAVCFEAGLGGMPAGRFLFRAELGRATVDIGLKIFAF